ncbi:hypothetical protein COCOBI_pt-1040 (chloroplast) [Coccomyxa sp. Obi]|nr:hypothetical protein COCOBI_pt-1040 [Coccomyxa sp. Obi]
MGYKTMHPERMQEERNSCQLLFASSIVVLGYGCCIRWTKMIEYFSRSIIDSVAFQRHRRTAGLLPGKRAVGEVPSPNCSMRKEDRFGKNALLSKGVIK